MKNKTVQISVPEYKKLLAINQEMNLYWGDAKKDIEKLTMNLISVKGATVGEIEELIATIKKLESKGEERLKKMREYETFVEGLMQK